MVFSKSANSDGVVADNVGDVVSNLPIESIVVVDKIRLSSVKTETLKHCWWWVRIPNG